MIAATAQMRGHRRSGITLTEILIAILIMGVGLVSLATLFPIGLLRLRDAARYSRSTYLGQAASADLSSRSLLLNFSFLNTGYYDSSISGYYNPFLQDTPYPGGDWAGALATTATSPGAYSGPGGVGLSGSSQSVAAANGSGTAVYPNLNGPGLPICYDPLCAFKPSTSPASRATTRISTIQARARPPSIRRTRPGSRRGLASFETTIRILPAPTACSGSRISSATSRP